MPLINGAPTAQRKKRTIRYTQKALDAQEAGATIPSLLDENAVPGRDVILDNVFGPLPIETVASPTKPKIGNFALPGLGLRPEDAVENPLSIHSFTPETFAIYEWDTPRPKDFLHLSDSRRAWRRRVDEQEKGEDVGDGSDDWTNFSGDLGTYCSLVAMNHSIARTFVRRAKRAFWAGKSWREFEDQERNADSEVAAKAEEHPKRREIVMAAALDNGHRLAIFGALRARLCAEIWLQPLQQTVTLKYVQKGASKPPARSRKSITPAKEAWLQQEEEGRGIVGWEGDGHGHLQPFYDGESKPPSGLREFMDRCEEDERRQRDSLTLGERHESGSGGGGIEDFEEEMADPMRLMAGSSPVRPS